MCFIVALEAVMRDQGGEGTVSALGVLIDRLEYADDASLIDEDAEQANARVSKLCEGVEADADMRISAPKSEVLFCRPRVETGGIGADAYKDQALKELGVDLAFKCQYCERGFDSWIGCRIHETRHCEVARRELTERGYESNGATPTLTFPKRTKNKRKA